MSLKFERLVVASEIGPCPSFAEGMPMAEAKNSVLKVRKYFSVDVFALSWSQPNLLTNNPG